MPEVDRRQPAGLARGGKARVYDPLAPVSGRRPGKSGPDASPRATEATLAEISAEVTADAIERLERERRERARKRLA